MTYYDEPTYDQCYQLLKECIAERGADYIYHNPESRSIGYEGPACLYVHDDGYDLEPGCIIGMMLNKHGIPLSVFDANMMDSVDRIWYQLFKVGLSGKKKALLQYTQHYQDMLNPWGESFDMAMEKVGEYESV